MLEGRLNELAKDIQKYREEKGFTTTWEDMPKKLMLVVTEISEAMEDWRKDNQKHFGEEIADTIIRCLDITSTLGIDIEAEIYRKMVLNKDRPYLHGGK